MMVELGQVRERRLSDFSLAGWQSLLDRHPHIFLGMLPGSRIGMLPEEDFESPGAAMLVWEATENGMTAAYAPFPGFPEVDVDLLFIASYAILDALHDGAHAAPFADIKDRVRRRSILLYVVKPRDQLLDQGYEEFLDSLGLVFMGACR
jgi:hypothetical protein